MKQLLYLLFTFFLAHTAFSQSKSNTLQVNLGLSVFTDMESSTPFQSWGGGFEYSRELSDRLSLGIGFESFKSQKDVEITFFDPDRQIEFISNKGDFLLTSQGFFINLSYKLLQVRDQFLSVQIGPAIQLSKLSYVPSEINRFRLNEETGGLIANLTSKFDQENADALGFFIGLKYGFNLSDRMGLLMDARSRTFSIDDGENYLSFSIGTFVKF